MTDQTTRPLHEIAREITSLWPDPYFGAIPYLDAMASLNSVTDSFGFDSGKDIVMYFLSNAKFWRGDDASRVKNELRVMVGQKPVVAKAAKADVAEVSPDAARALRKHDAAIVKAAVVRAIFCPFTGDILDMRRAVVVDTGTKRFVCTAAHWDAVKDEILVTVELMKTEIKVYDGRELYTPAGRVR